MNWPLITSVGHFIFKLAKKTIEKARKGAPGPALESGTDMVKCPRCFTYVPSSGSISATVKGYTLHFCSKECFEAYRRDHQEIDAIPLDEGKQ